MSLEAFVCLSIRREDKFFLVLDFCTFRVISQSGLSAIMLQIYFQSNLNLISAGSSVQILIQGIIDHYSL